ncbi:MAG TPA: methyltransferase [bacterium]|nr:methyltransferase [bacterium]
MPAQSCEYIESAGLGVCQPKSGYRYGEASIALANFVCARPGLCVVELGGGCGIVSMIVARRCRPVSVVSVEIQRCLHDLAVRNSKANGLGAVLRCVNADYRMFARKRSGLFDLVVANPPFYPAKSGRLPLNPQRAAAHHELNGTLKDLVDSASLLLMPGGRFAAVILNSRRIELTATAEAAGLSLCRFVRGGEDESGDALFLAEFAKRGEG